VGRGRDGGSVSLELAVLGVLIFVLVGGFLTLVGRSNIAEGSIQSAARAAARAASLTRTSDAAQTAGSTAAAQALADAHVPCSAWSLAMDTSQFAAALGRPAALTATVTCTVPYGDLLVPGVPGSRTLHAAFTSVLDEYRARG
jgi:hypothetical protein